MSKIIYTDLVNVETIKSAVIVQGVNILGGYGAGFSGFLATVYPEVYKSYRKDEPKTLGKVTLIHVDEDRDVYVANAYTQPTFGTPDIKHARPEAIQECLDKVIHLAVENSIGEIYMPKIGCGLGGLDWEVEVKPLVETAAEKAFLEGIHLHVVEFFF